MSICFDNPYTHAFYRCAAATPYVKPADINFNLGRHIDMARQATDVGAGLLVFPEMSLSGYSVGDLCLQEALLAACRSALIKLAEASINMSPVIVAGLPLFIGARLYNCAAVVHAGRILGVVPKTFLANHGEFYEKRHFSSADELKDDEMLIRDMWVPIGNDLLFACENYPEVILGIEICEDLWAPVPVSARACLAGATIIANPSASNALAGKADHRRLLVKATSGRNICGYIYSGAGQRESTADLVWDGQAILAENAVILKENERYVSSDTICFVDIDSGSINNERARTGRISNCQNKHSSQDWRKIYFRLDHVETVNKLVRPVDRFPYVPSDPANPAKTDEHCQEVINIQTQGLVSRLEASGIRRVVLGVSGGLDSTLALLVACKAFDRLGLDRTGIIACSLPGMGTSEKTLQQARALIKAVGVTFYEVDITPACMLMLNSLDHPFARGEKVYDVTFENVQAGERTSLLFRLANSEKGMVLGTGDLSELSLGWCTYGVGDHMSHYNVNASVAKTLIRAILKWVLRQADTSKELAEVVQAVLETRISPELIPGDGSLEPEQDTEAVVGPYELQDFILYYLLRHGFAPSKIAFLCKNVWGCGKNSYSFAEIKKWLRVFISRFFARSQFKRNSVPDSPKVCSGGSLSPRGDWRAPSDSSADLWLEELESSVPD